MRRNPHESALGVILKKQKKRQIQKNCANEKARQKRKVQSFANKAVFFQATNGGQKKDKSLFLDSNKKLKLRMACGLEKDVPGSEKREAV